MDTLLQLSAIEPLLVRRRHRQPWELALAAPLLALLLACADDAMRSPAGDGAAPKLRSSVDKVAAIPGDVVTFEIVAEHDAADEVDLPTFDDQIGDLEIVDSGQDREALEGERIRVRHWYKLRADTAGSYILPAIEGRVRTHIEADAAASAERPIAERESEALRTSEIFVDVESLLAKADEAAQIRDIKPLRPAPATLPWGLVVVAAMAAAALAGALFLVRRRKSNRPPEPPIPAHVRALEALRALSPDSFDNLRALRRYYFELSRVLRSYLEGQFALNATDMTSEEILAVIDELRLEGTAESLLRGFLSDSDRVKFAAHTPSEGEVRDIYERALRFVERTRPPETTTAAEA